MALPLYLAMTAGEIQENSVIPPNCGYMACHFSPYGTGLSNLPKTLPPGSLLILNDRTPICGHDPGQICHQLTDIVEKYDCMGLLLDFQRPDREETGELAEYLDAALPFHVAVSHHYANCTKGPVLLPPVPLDTPLREYLPPWNSREIWLEGALDGLLLSLTPSGCTMTPLPHPGFTGGHPDRRLHCHYHIAEKEDQMDFALFRTREDLYDLLTEAETFGVTLAVGLWQELG